ncbi:hypothetical protein [Rhodanobacter spathiphylli]|uniref:hypothetical protein n=1 Tax=Rhodanobacter spathiphylli TaxID=347483 RepID=UPI000A04E147
MKKFGITTLGLALAVAGISLPSFASAQNVTSDSASSSPLYFANVDKNGDGVISRSEVPKDLPGLRAHFDQYDLNRDHRLSEGEYVSYLGSIGSTACRDDQHTEAKCQVSPYAGDARRQYSGESPAVRPPKGSGG